MPETRSRIPRRYGTMSFMLQDSETAPSPPRHPLLDSATPLRWVLTGDSVTHGSTHTSGERSYPELFAERLRWELGRTRDHVVNTGVSGRRVGDLAADLDWSVLHYRPHVVSLMLGLNDCVGGGSVEEFADVLEQIVSRLLDDGTTVILHTPNRVLATDPARRAALPPFVDAVREIAARRPVVLVDHHEAWRRVDESGELEYWISHGCHPNAFGHRMLARTLLEALGAADPTSPTGRLFVPADGGWVRQEPR